MSFLIGAITNAAILLENDPAQVANNRLSDRSNLQLIIRGETTGGRTSSVVWRRNGTVVDRSTVVAGGSFYDGGGEAISSTGDCSTHRYRAALLVTGYLPGEYSYTATNGQTTSPVTSPVFRVEGKYTSIEHLYLDVHLCVCTFRIRFFLISILVMCSYSTGMASELA